VVLELNAENVRKGKALDLPIYYADATSAEALTHAHLSEARLLVLLMNDPQAAERVVATARRVAPAVPVLMRTRYLLERERLLKIGASDVVAEEVEGAVEVIARMLRSLEVPRNLIDQSIHDVRSETQSSERKQTIPRATLRDLRGLDDLKIESVSVRAGSPAAGASIAALRLRTVTGALAVGVRRGERLFENPDIHMAFAVDDVVYLVGTSEAVRRALALFQPDAEAAEALSA
jgi:CPA2 family monovalent cation:H+ antiporter-2